MTEVQYQTRNFIPFRIELEDIPFQFLVSTKLFSLEFRHLILHIKVNSQEKRLLSLNRNRIVLKI